MFQGSIKYVLENDFEHVSRSLADDGFRVFELNGSGVNNAASFFVEVIRSLPVDPPLSGKVHYDALIDSLWYGIYHLQSSRVAILWRQASVIAGSNPNDLRLIIDCFKDVIEGLASPEFTLGNPVSLVVFLFGVEEEAQGLQP